MVDFWNICYNRNQELEVGGQDVVLYQELGINVPVCRKRS